MTNNTAMNNAIQIYKASIKVGDVIPVRKFFWIKDLIGYDSDAKHGHGIKDKGSAGSVEEGCTLTVRAIDGDMAIVRLDRPEVPYGAPAAIGAVFFFPVATLEEWSDPNLDRAAKAEAKRMDALRKKYLR